MNVVFDVMNQLLLIKYPLIIRRINYSQEIMNKVENPSEFDTTAINVDFETCPLATTVIFKFTECFPENTLNNKIKQYIYEELSNVPNINP